MFKARIWSGIETIFEKADNEHRHLLTFLGLLYLGWIMEVVIIGAQEVFLNSHLCATPSTPTLPSLCRVSGRKAARMDLLTIQDIEEDEEPG